DRRSRLMDADVVGVWIGSSRRVECPVDRGLEAGRKSQTTKTRIEVHPGQAGVVAGAEKLDRRQRTGGMVSQELLERSMDGNGGGITDIFGHPAPASPGPGPEPVSRLASPGAPKESSSSSLTSSRMALTLNLLLAVRGSSL